MVLNDFQRGKLPYYMKPPGCEEDEGKVKKAKKDGLDEPETDLPNKEEKELQDDVAKNNE